MGCNGQVSVPTVLTGFIFFFGNEHAHRRPGAARLVSFVIGTGGVRGVGVHGRIDESGDARRGEKTGTRAGTRRVDVAWARDSPKTAHRKGMGGVGETPRSWGKSDR